MSNRIEVLIREKGYSLTSLAERMGTTKQNLYGKLKSPSYPTLCEIATALNVELWELFTSEQEVMQRSGNSVVCPRCGAKLTVKFEE